MGVEAVGDRDRPLVGVRPVAWDVDGPALHVGVVVAGLGERRCRARGRCRVHGLAARHQRAEARRRRRPPVGLRREGHLAVGQAPRPAAVRIDDVEVQAAALALGHETGDDQLPAVRRPRRTERVSLATAMMCDRGDAGPVGMDGVDVRRLARVLIPVAVERDPGAVGRPIGARRVELVGRDLLEACAVGVDDEDRGLRRALHPRERDARPVGRPLGLRVVRILARERGGQPVRAAPVLVGHEDPVDRGLTEAGVLVEGDLRAVGRVGRVAVELGGVERQLHHAGAVRVGGEDVGARLPPHVEGGRGPIWRPDRVLGALALGMGELLEPSAVGVDAEDLRALARGRLEEDRAVDRRTCRGRKRDRDREAHQHCTRDQVRSTSHG